MAETTWTNGVGDGDASNDGNWSGVKPAAGDTAICDATSTADITSGLDFDGVDLAAWKTTEDYSGNIGASGNPLIIAADLVEHRGSGTLYYKNGNGGVGLLTNVLRVDSDNLKLAAQIDDAISRVELIKGRVEATATANAGLYYVSYRTRRDDDVFLKIASTSDNFTLYQNGGVVFCDASTLLTLNVAAGILITLGASAATNVRLLGGTIRWKSTGGISSRCFALGGLLDFSQNLASKTIDELHEFPDARVVLGDHVTVPTYNKVNTREPIC